jgi:hypothetical protein
MKMKRLCTLAVLLTSSLASAAGDVAASLESQYYAGLNFGAGWGGGFVVKPSVVFGYHYDQNSKFELEVLSNVKSLKSIGASLLANYRFYPDLDIDPVKLYVSGGLGGYLQIVPFGFGGGSTGIPTSKKDVGTQTGKIDVGTQTGEKDVGTQTDEEGVGTQTDEEGAGTQTDEEGGDAAGAISATTVSPIYANKAGGEKPEGQSVADKILGSISYKLKVGVDYEITPQIVGAVGITVGGQLSGFKPPIKMPDATLEVGIRYNF